VLDGETGWVVPGAPTTLAARESSDRIVTLLQDPELRHRMGTRGRRWVEERWRWDLLSERLRALL
ncbi:glycosyltransferase, partial [Streptomyces sp. NPDC057582]